MLLLSNNFGILLQVQKLVLQLRRSFEVYKLKYTMANIRISKPIHYFTRVRRKRTWRSQPERILCCLKKHRYRFQKSKKIENLHCYSTVFPRQLSKLKLNALTFQAVSVSVSVSIIHKIKLHQFEVRPCTGTGIW
jgi:hypothetical protein